MRVERTCQTCGERFPQRRQPTVHHPQHYCSLPCAGIGRQRSLISPDGPPWTVDENGCWIWDLTVMANGYGVFAGHEYAHRWVYEQVKGPIPRGLDLDHVKERGCRSRACCNPEHLEPVTRAENLRRGVRTRLSRPLAAEIRRLHAAGARPADLGRQFDVAATTISGVVHGHTWKD